MNERAPVSLREAITSDLRPVRPLATPWVRAAILLPAAVIALVAAPWILGLRADVRILGAGMSWGISAVQMLIGIVLVGLALHEAVPGRALSPRVLGASFAAALALVIGVTVTTFVMSPSVEPESLRALLFGFCLTGSTIVGAPLVLLAGFLAARALPLRPWIAGALYGLGAGLMADAGWRLFCDLSVPGHVLSAHGGAVLILMLLGILAAEIGERARHRMRGD